MDAMRNIFAANPRSIEKAASMLKEGGLVAIPTETVYGLAANAFDGKAVAKIFAAKGRPSFNPLIVHVHDLEHAQEIAEFGQKEFNLAQSFWPGALTLILKCKENSKISDLVTCGLSTIAVRIPAHKTTRALLKACNVPLAAPSANKSGTLSPTTPAHVAESLGEKIDLILADGACPIGIESTVLDCSGDIPIILRAGIITAEEISSILKEKVSYDFGDHSAPKSPGQLLKHYAPTIPLRLNAIDVEEGEALLAFGSTRFMALRGIGRASDLSEEKLCNLSKDGDLYEAAANLFSMLRFLDQPIHKRIAAMPIPNQGIGIAINDRLRRAAKG